MDQRHELAWFNKGARLEEMGGYQEAIRYHEKALDINPETDLAFNQILGIPDSEFIQLMVGGIIE